MAVAKNTEAKAYEMFTPIYDRRKFKGKCALKTQHGMFLSAKKDGTIQADSLDDKKNEQFEIWAVAHGRFAPDLLEKHIYIAFKTSFGTWICANKVNEDGSGGNLSQTPHCKGGEMWKGYDC